MNKQDILNINDRIKNITHDIMTLYSEMGVDVSDITEKDIYDMVLKNAGNSIFVTSTKPTDNSLLNVTSEMLIAMEEVRSNGKCNMMDKLCVCTQLIKEHGILIELDQYPILLNAFIQQKNNE